MFILLFTNLTSTMSPVLRSGTGLSCSAASIALLFKIYGGSDRSAIEKNLFFLFSQLINEKNKSTPMMSPSLTIGGPRGLASTSASSCSSAASASAAAVALASVSFSRVSTLASGAASSEVALGASNLERITGEVEDPNAKNAAGKQAELVEIETEEETVRRCCCCCRGREATEGGIRRNGRVAKEAAIRE